MNRLFLEFIDELNKHNVKYIIIGGQAVILHGHIRTTKDIDILIEETKANIDNLFKAIEIFFGASINADVSASFYNERDSFLMFGREPNRIDILKHTVNIEFSNAYSKRLLLTVDGIQVNIVDIDNLIENKEAVGRPLDLDDVDNLKKIRAIKRK